MTTVTRRPAPQPSRGVTTAEYAVVTAAGCGFGGRALIKLLTSDWGQELLKTLFDFFLELIGLG